MSNEAVQLQPEGMLTTIHNNLDKRFFAANKADAKRLFKSISNGYTVPFVKIATSSSGDITCDLKLDHSCFVGTLNFRRFRHALASHLSNVAEKLNSKEDLNIYTNAESGDMLFNIPGIIDDDGVVNILTTGISQQRPGALLIQLMFLDPDNVVADSD
ncbi:MAG: hypothetical protein ACI88G_000248 [Woeseiaceae bacterium]|jgi:hypothetical protein